MIGGSSINSRDVSIISQQSIPAPYNPPTSQNADDQSFENQPTQYGTKAGNNAAPMFPLMFIVLNTDPV